MAHHTVRSRYQDLVERLNRFPQGAPPSELLYKILKLLFSEREAGLVALLPIKPFDRATAARIWKMTEAQAGQVLDELAGRGILLDILGETEQLYVLPPARRFGILNAVQTTNFLPRLDPESCHGCGKCVAACPVEAMSLVSANDPAKAKKKAARLDESICLGCGVCVTVCPQDGIGLEPRGERLITPVDSTHRVVRMAVERGMLQNLIFDNRALTSHRAMAAILGVILNLPPVKRAMASEQVKSRYLDRLIHKHAES